MKFALQFFFLCVLSGTLKEINGGETGSCEEECLYKPEMEKKEKCDQMSKSSDSLAFYYDSKTSSCLSSNCLQDYDHYFKTNKECSEGCATCSRLLKHYKPEDNCLKHTVVEVMRSETSPPAPNPTNVWIFDKGPGKCVESNIYNTMLKKDWYVKEGIVETTKDACNKKCPPV